LSKQEGGQVPELRKFWTWCQKKLHQRTALIIGSKDDVALVESFIQQQAKEQGEKKT